MTVSHDVALRRLTVKAEQAAAARRPAFAPIGAPRRGLPKPVLAWILSRFVEGEEATARFCAEARDDLSSVAARRFIDLQRADEERHATLYKAYMRGLGITPRASAALSDIYRRARAFDGPVEGRLLAFHVVLERDNLALQRNAARLLGCPGFEAMTPEITRDEARHVAFGELYLRHHLPKLPLADRRAIHDWLRDLWFEAADEILREALGPIAPLGALDRRRRRERGWAKRQDALRAAGLFRAEEAVTFGRAA